jgi:hypothetical protein
MTTVQCTLVVPADQALLAKALWTELGLDDFEFVQAAELSDDQRQLSGPVNEAFVSALRRPETLHHLASQRGMDLDFEQIAHLCSVMRIPIS